MYLTSLQIRKALGIEKEEVLVSSSHLTYELRDGESCSPQYIYEPSKM